MRTRNKEIHLRLSEEEYMKLTENARKCGLSRSQYLIMMINDVIPKESPPIEYHLMVKELHAIGNNLNQIAKGVNTTNEIDKFEYEENAERLRKALLNIMHAATFPTKR